MSEYDSKPKESLRKFLTKFNTNSLHQKINLQKVGENLENLNKISNLKSSANSDQNNLSKIYKLILIFYLSQIQEK